MRLNKKTLIKIIKEELKKTLNESTSKVNIYQLVNVEDGDSDSIPLMYDGELMEAYSPSVTSLLINYFSETLDGAKIQKLASIVDDDITKLCLDESGFQVQELLRTLDPKFQGIPEGDLKFDRDYGYVNIKVKLGPSGLKIVSGEENIDEDGDLEVELNAYGSMPSFDYTSIMNPSSHLYNNYFDEMDIGSGGYGNQDVGGSVYVKIHKILEDVNNGKLGIFIKESYGDIEYIIQQRYG